jgi:hypothetical protein
MPHRPTQGVGSDGPGSGTSARARPNQVRTVVASGAVKNRRSIRLEIVVRTP